MNEVNLKIGLGKIIEQLPKHYSNVRCSQDNPMVPLSAVETALSATVLVERKRIYKELNAVFMGAGGFVERSQALKNYLDEMGELLK